jgi:hypothetical protein
MTRAIDLLLLGLALACGRRDSSDAAAVDTAMVFVSTPTAARGSTRLRVSITTDAKLLADGRQVTVGALDSLLSATQAARGGVWLYQDNSARKRGSRSDSLFKRVAEASLHHHLPVWFAHRPDFADLEATLSDSSRH